MIGIITLLLSLVVQLGLFVSRLITKSPMTKVKHFIRISAFAIFSILLIGRVYWWGFRWMGFFILLLIFALTSAIYFIKRPKKEKSYKALSAVLSLVGGCMLLTSCILPGIIFPQFEPIAPTGTYKVDTASTTFTDTSRVDVFSETGENRKLTVQFWYPDTEDIDASYPLVVFSHGSFGYRGSNQSTFENLARNGYVVCSIDHSYHSFFSKHTDGSMTLVNTDFLNDAVNIENGLYDEQATYDLTTEWLELRIDDMDFVIDEIIKNTDIDNTQKQYSLIDIEKIGLFGHSLGGAAAAQLGRERSDIDSAIVVDGTMIGEQIALDDGKRSFNTEPYPIPLLNLFNESHYEDALREGMEYNNIYASTNAIEAYDVVIRGSGHLNFTDLPLFSPTLAKILGTGEVDSRYCIETMNKLTLNFFNHTLKDSGGLNIKNEY